MADLANLAADVNHRELGCRIVFKQLFVVRAPQQVLKRLHGSAASGRLLDVRLVRCQILITGRRTSLRRNKRRRDRARIFPSDTAKSGIYEDVLNLRRFCGCRIDDPQFNSRGRNVSGGNVLTVRRPLRLNDLSTSRQGYRHLPSVRNILQLHADKIRLTMLTIRIRVDSQTSEPQHRLRKFRDRGITQRFEQRHPVAHRRYRNRWNSRRIQNIHYFLRRLFIALSENKSGKEKNYQRQKNFRFHISEWCSMQSPHNQGLSREKSYFTTSCALST